MSASETELTFIRCPSCRSLVPSVAVRCRMCGHQFEKTSASGESVPPPAPPAPPAPPVAPPTSNGSAKSVQPSPAAPEEQEAKGGTSRSGLSWQIGSRVRQRTISATPEEMEELKREFTSTLPPEPVEAPDLEEIPELEAVVEETEPLPPPTPPVPLAPPQRTIAARDVHEETHEEEFEESEFSDDEGDDSDSDGEQGDGRRRRRRRRKKKRTQFDGSSPVETKPIQSVEPVRPMDQPREPQRVQPREDLRDQPREERRPTNFRGDRSFEQRPSSIEPVAAPAKFREPTVGAENQLVGWLVNYDINPNGVSAELRSGKYFVTSKKLRPGDFVIEDDTVSMPHCMVTAVTGDGLYLQDLMSEKGTSICRAGSSQWEPLTAQQKLGNGDRIRFGAHEAMLVLVPKT